MKILNRKKFLALPENTLYSKYEPCAFDELNIKGESWDIDFFTMPLNMAVKAESSSKLFDILFDAEENKTSIKMDFETEGRDGMFDEDQLFAVWENEDIIGLIEALKKCIK